MEHVVSLIETIIWVGLIVWLVLRFQLQIEVIVKSLRKRIDSGCTIKAGPFAIEDLRPQPLEDQKKKVQDEIQESIERDVGSNDTKAISKEVAIHQSDYFQAEDLALRAIQADYGVTINRQVTAGRDPGFDAAFVKDGRLHIVEVKYVPNLSSVSRFRASIERIVDSIEIYHWKNVELILAVVMANDIDIHDADAKFLQALQGIQTPVKIRPFYFGELEARFGIES